MTHFLDNQHQISHGPTIINCSNQHFLIVYIDDFLIQGLELGF